MLAVQFAEYGGPEVLRLQKIDAGTPGPDDVLIDVHAVSLNPIDWKIRAGLLRAIIPLTFPATVGRDGAGRVIAVGSNVDPALNDARVCFFAPRGVGTWAEQIVLPSSCLARLPTPFPWPKPRDCRWLDSAPGLLWSRPRKSQPACAFSFTRAPAASAPWPSRSHRARGAHVITTCSARNRDFVTKLGAHQVIAYDEAPFESQLRDVDVVFDLLGGDVHRRSYAVLKRGGTMVCLVAEPFEDRSAEFGVTVVTAPILPKQESLEALVALVTSGALRVPVEQQLPLAEFKAAHEMSQQGHMRGKLVMTVREPA